LEVAGLQQKRTPATLFVRPFTCSMLQLVPQQGTEDLAIGCLLMTGTSSWSPIFLD
jgi:hypothetical protein